MLGGGIFAENFMIYSNSKAANRSLPKVLLKFFLAHEYGLILTGVSGHSKVTMSLVR